MVNQEVSMLNDVYTEAKNRMKGAVQALEEDLAAIRTGRASPALVEKLQVEYYGVLTSLIQLASIGVPEPRSLLIRVEPTNPVPPVIKISAIQINPLIRD